MDGVITAYEEDKLVALDLTGKMFDLSMTYTLSEIDNTENPDTNQSGGAIRVVQDVDVRFKGFMKVLMWFMAPFVRKQSAKECDGQMGRLKVMCEAEYLANQSGATSEGESES